MTLRLLRPVTPALVVLLLAALAPAAPVAAQPAGAPAPARAAVTSVPGPDVDPPLVVAPAAAPKPGAQVDAKSVPFTVSWSATDDSGVARYGFQQRVDGGDWQTMTLPTAVSTSVTLALMPPHEYQFRVRAYDTLGNRSDWATGETFRVRRISESSPTIARTGSWSLRENTGFLGDHAYRASAAGASATLTFTGSGVAWIATRSAVRGQASVVVDGEAPVIVDLYRATTSFRRQVFTRTWTESGPHTLVITVLGTAGHPYVDIDGFTIVDPPATDPVLVGAGDIADCQETADNATANLLDGIAGRVFAAGDTVYPDGTATQYHDCYGPTWGRWKRRTSPVVGNHEYHMTGAVPYFNYFGARAGEAGKGWYAYDLGTWRVYNLNSNCAEVGCGVGSEQLEWLVADLAANPRACVAAVWHHPRFSSGQHGNNTSVAELWKALEAAGAELVLTGHDHDYERFAAQTNSRVPSASGIVEYVVGTGGADLRPFVTVKPNSLVRNAKTHGVLKLTLKAGSWDWTFVGTPGSTFRDSGSATCH